MEMCNPTEKFVSQVKSVTLKSPPPRPIVATYPQSPPLVLKLTLYLFLVLFLIKININTLYFVYTFHYYSHTHPYTPDYIYEIFLSWPLLTGLMGALVRDWPHMCAVLHL